MCFPSHQSEGSEVSEGLHKSAKFKRTPKNSVVKINNILMQCFLKIKINQKIIINKVYKFSRKDERQDQPSLSILPLPPIQLDIGTITDMIFILKI